MGFLVKYCYFIIITSILLTLVGCNSDNTNNAKIKAIPSPNGEYIAYSFVRDLGATTRESYQLSVLKNNENLSNASGNVYVSYNDFEVTWKNDKELVIKRSGFGTRDVFKHVANIGDVKITYIPTFVTVGDGTIL